MTALHYKQEDIDFDLEIGEYFLSIETTPYYEYVKTAYILIGTNIGTILLIGKELQKRIYYLRKYTLKIEPIIKICYYNNNKFIYVFYILYQSTFIYIYYCCCLE